MAHKFYSPSINIVRDYDKPFVYIPTPNTKGIYDLIINNYSIGVRSYNIVGSYGTGKSSFLWALEKSFNKRSNVFPPLNGYFKEIDKFEYLPIVGDYASFVNSFASKCGISENSDFSVKELFKKFDSYYRKLQKSKTGLLIVADEFGKFLEYASENGPEQELYFIQQLAEYVNDVDKNILFITTLHQNFSSYANNLTKSQQHEWDKVKGRLKEITFNEPVEQLLYLAAERLKQDNIDQREFANFDKLFSVIKGSNTFPLKDYFNKDIAAALLPFDILSASILTSALQLYGQNERSLFSFIESRDYLSLGDYDQVNNPYFNLCCVYDYLIHNFYSYLTSKHNTHFPQWSTIRMAIETAEGIDDERMLDVLKIIKVVGLLNIFSNAAAKIDLDFLCAYCSLSAGIKQPEKTIDLLEKKHIIKYSELSQKYIFVKVTDLDIERAIIEAANQIDKTINVVSFLSSHFDFPYIQAKEVFYRLGTPRFFSIKITESPIESVIDNNIDGIINLIFSEHFKESDIKKKSLECEDVIIYGYFKEYKEIKKLIFEIEKANKVRENNLNDIIALKELDAIIAHHKLLLNQNILSNLYTSGSSISWFFQGERLQINNHKEFNRRLSYACETIYANTPDYKCELINKIKPSGTVVSSKKNIFKQLVENGNLPELGFESNKFPPEKTIYLSLLNATGIHVNGNFITDPAMFKNTSFKSLWKDSVDFIQKSKSGKVNIEQFVEMLAEKPYKLKHGFISIWIPVFLFIHRNDFALFDNDGFVFDIDDNILDLISKSPEGFEIKAFDVEGVKLDLFNNYRILINQTSDIKPSNQSFIELIKPFLAFYHSLPEYSKKTKSISKNARSLREAIQKAEDPEKAFFEDFPNALNYNIVELSKDSKKVEEYIKTLQDNIREIRMSYSELILRIENFICENIVGESLSFPAYRDTLIKRFSKLKKYLLPSLHKVFYQRLTSEIDNNSMWINSISQALLGKSLEVIDDNDENILFEKFKNIIFELDNLSELSKSNVDNSKEDLIKFEITTFVKGFQKRFVRLPKKQSEEIDKLKSEIEQKLSSYDRAQNIALLVKLLQDQIEDDKKS